MDITVEEAAQRLGISQATVKRRLERRQIAGRKVGRQWIVDDAKLPAPSRSRVAVARPSGGVDLQVAFEYVKTTDLNELWVPDVLRWADYISDRTEVLAEAARCAVTGTCTPTEIEVPKTPMLTRPAVLLTVADRVAYQGLVSAILPAIEGALTSRVYSSRATSGPPYLFKKSTKQWILWHRRVAKEVKHGAVWVARTDITAYFESVDHGILFKELAAIGANEAVLQPLRAFLSACGRTNGRGLPQGPNASRALGNFYLSAVDHEMIQANTNYWRYMDDIIIAGRTKAEALAGIRLLEKECRKRGLILNAQKTKLLTGPDAVTAGGDPRKDRAQYFMDSDQATRAKRDLRKILYQAITDEGNVDVGSATFSLWRLARLMDRVPLPRVLDRLEDLGPVARVGAAYLRKFLANARVEHALGDYLLDPSKNTSAVTESWFFACMLEHPGQPPESWIERARTVATDRNGASYHRALAVNVMVLSAKPRDVAWVKSELRREYDPAMLRAYLVSLARVGELDRTTLTMTTNRAEVIRPAADYLRNRTSLPSLVWRGKEVKIK